MHPIDPNHIPTPMEIAECIEALLGASFQCNTIIITNQIVEKLITIIKSNSFDSVNYINILQEYCDRYNINHPEYPDPEPIMADVDKKIRFSQKIILNYNNKELIEISEEFPRKDEAKQHAARLMLIRLGEITDTDLTSLEKPEISVEQPVHASKSIESDMIVFQNQPSEKKNQLLYVSSRPEEALVDWAKRKAQKNPFGMLLLLSARIGEIAGASWTAEINNGYLVLLNLALDGQLLFEIGFGLSKSQARKKIAQKIIENNQLYDYLASHY